MQLSAIPNAFAEVLVNKPVWTSVIPLKAIVRAIESVATEITITVVNAARPELLLKMFFIVSQIFHELQRLHVEISEHW